VAAELKQQFGVESTLTPGHGGIFEVSVDGKVIFSRKLVGRFPKAGEVVAILKKNK